ncbi:bifunctional UDP-N-acetylglucosamine diphosphorylase/glucosamine-1-phosphate N-acetyltransferase GlmU [Blastomonas sp.]|uniref:bifunctional UDP-N-acetylglucosamine diphosphorylase/glucosamine-1-phosphate N-acetyltransferase GlmU n=1 Tax=Blastomonas sp. TaxID=1909299 RepID=UPI00260BBF38|nr:bifunctional UDP-N-acetylglucosamine diphosphorylase/glucosamine-1-phosphate N-acetyltransferase GlmU [Blastomonas sp.]MDM7956443.1 bifunctional UDP-N-acetylglucosamine diphosphorylase/glucosamine-1-phosphate N-acetyltransferase GlmU [Blastomonas sp.]
MGEQALTAIILAAGQGTRMKSDLHKVLHPVAGLSMLHHLLESLTAAGAARQVVVVGARREQVEASVAPRGVAIAHQAEQLGTAHAALQAKAALADFDGTAIVCFGDTPFLKPDTIRRLTERLSAPDAPRVAVLGFTPDDAKAYGRIIADESGTIAKMVEFKDASDHERSVRLCNSGVTAVRTADLWPLLERVGNDNAAGEYYLPDIVMLAIADGDRAVVVETDADELIGINSRAELAEAESIWQARRRAQVMADGASLVAPETVWFAHDTVIGRDVVIEPNVVFGPGVTIADDVVIHAFSHLEGATIASGCSVGPFARLRPGAQMQEGAKVGNFVEMKKAVLGPGAKASHLTYLGDATVGANANIGAGTITCNYDGYFKYQTVIGENAFIGSNSSLIAPVKIGRDAIVAAGSAVSRDVADGELRLVRGEQLVKPGWADRFHDAMRRRKREGK